MKKIKTMQLCLIILTIYGCYSRNPEKTGLEGTPMPSFKLLMVDSTTTFDTKDLPKGKSTALFYFGPHCPYSHAQMEDIIANINNLKDIQFVALTAWPFPQFKEFYQKYHLEKYDNIKAGVDYTVSFRRYFNSQGVPYLAIYNKDQILNHSYIGLVNSDQIKAISVQ